MCAVGVQRGIRKVRHASVRYSASPAWGNDNPNTATPHHHSVMITQATVPNLRHPNLRVLIATHPVWVLEQEEEGGDVGLQQGIDGVRLVRQHELEGHRHAGTGEGRATLCLLLQRTNRRADGAWGRRGKERQGERGRKDRVPIRYGWRLSSGE